jgi:hypothetical protein
MGDASISIDSCHGHLLRRKPSFLQSELCLLAGTANVATSFGERDVTPAACCDVWGDGINYICDLAQGASDFVGNTSGYVVGLAQVSLLPASINCADNRRYT